MADGKQHLLVVEDEPILRETLTYNLRREGYAVAASGDGSEALQLARERCAMGGRVTARAILSRTVFTIRPPRKR